MKPYLDTLLDTIDPNLLIEQLQEILRFLKSNQTELCFIHISIFMEQLLVTIVKNNENLNFLRLSYISNGLSDVIYGILKSTQNIFTLISEYETGRLNKKVLFYKKLFHHMSTRPDCTILQPHSLLQSPLQTQMARIQANSMCQIDRCVLLQKLPKKNKKNIKAKKHDAHDIDADQVNNKPDDDMLPIFKKASLLTILDFINDERRATLVFHQKTRIESRFLASVRKKTKTNPHNDVKNGIPENCRPILAKIGDSLKKSTHFNLSFYEGKTDKTTGLRDITFIKNPFFSKDVAMPKNTIKATHGNSETDEDKPITLQKLLLTPDNDVPDLTALSITDNSKPAKSEENKRGKMGALKWGHATPKVVTTDGSRERSLSHQRKLSCNKLNFRPPIDIDAVPAKDIDKPASARDKSASAGDIPASVRDKSASARDKSASARDKPVSARDKSASVRDKSASARDKSASARDKPASATDKSASARDKPASASDKLSKPMDKPTPMKSDKTLRKLSANRINFRAPIDKDLAIDKQASAIAKPSSTRDNRSRSCERRLDGRTSKLLADMSTPMKSDKAMRMMKGMGWDGGALGTRGDGITEPIIPALGIPKKAGLGLKLPQKQSFQPNPPPKRQPSPPQQPTQQQRPPYIHKPDFAKSVYEKLYEFLTSESTSKEIDYISPLTKNEVKLLRAAIQTANSMGKGNSRMTYDLCTFVMKIKENIKIAPNYRVELNLSANLMRSTFIKIFKNNKERPIIEKTERTGRITSSVFQQTMEQLPKMILRLIQTHDTEMTVDFDDTLTKEQCEFVDNIVNWINSKSGDINDIGPIFDKNIYSEIKECVGGVVMAVKFDEKSFIIIKKCPVQTRFGDIVVNKAKNIDSNNDFDADVVMVSDYESDAMSNKDDVVSIKSETKCDEIVLDAVVLKEVKDTVRDVNSDNFYECLKDLEELIKTEKSGPLLNKDIKEETSWENLQGNSSEATFVLNAEVISVNTKRALPETDTVIPIIKKVRLEGSEYKRVRIAPKNSEEVLNREKIKDIQTLISVAIDNAAHLTLLNCHGFINGALIYDCHDEKTLFFLKNIVDATSDYSIVECDEALLESHKMAIKINSFLDINVEKMFQKIELYNPGLWTDDWTFIKKSEYCNFIIITVFVDDKSLKYISNANFSLFAGIDKIQFSVIWD